MGIRKVRESGKARGGRLTVRIFERRSREKGEEEDEEKRGEYGERERMIEFREGSWT